MSKKSAKIAALIESCQGQGHDAHYLGYFKCFNEGYYYEAHDVLEELWLGDRQGPNYSFYKGLIQLAGAFVHLQKNRLKPSFALFNLAKANLLKYPALHEDLDLATVLSLISEWSCDLEKNGFLTNPYLTKPAPKLELMPHTSPSKGTFLIATRNKHKIQEIRAMIGENFAWLNLADYPDAPEVVEDAVTFEGNAHKKSHELALWLHRKRKALDDIQSPLLVLADDSGLEVDALNGAPGVYSARFAAIDSQLPGNSKDADNNAKLLRMLTGVEPARKTARFRCVIALTIIPSAQTNPADWKVEIFDGKCEGRIAESPAGQGGFGYDPLFVPDGHDCSFAELGEAVKNKISHRAMAMEGLRKFLGVAGM